MPRSSGDNDRVSPHNDDPRVWLAAVRRSHDHLAQLVGGRHGSELIVPSACSEWNVAQVVSHLGSQAEIFSLFVDSALEGREAPGREAFEPIWNGWNAKPPAQQVSDGIAANERLVRRLEGLDDEALAAMRLDLFGGQRDAVGLLRMRLSEHAIHTWDVEVAFDPSAQVAPDAVGLLIDNIPEMVPRAGRAAAAGRRVAVTTADPELHLNLDTGGVSIRPGDAEATDATLEIPAEGLLRLVYGRLGDAHPPRGPVRSEGISLEDLQEVFPGF